MRGKALLRGLAAAMLLLALPARPEAAGAPADHLERVVILTRHGIRAAMSTPEELGRWTAEAWPAFAVPPGHLTAHGFQAASLFGAYYREHYRASGLLPAGDCAAAQVHANLPQRTVETGRALAEQLLPGCPARVDTVATKADPLFDPVPAGATHLDPDLALAAVRGRIGDATAWTAAHTDTVEALQRLLLNCAPVECRAQVQPGGRLAGRRLLTDVPSALDRGQGEDWLRLQSPLATASGLTESLIMAYADGAPLDGLLGGRVNADALNRAGAAHAADLDARLRIPYIARVGAGPLARHLANLLADDGPAVTVLVGHDGTLLLLAGLLRLDWVLPGYQPDQVPPGSALVLERWRRADGQTVIRARFTAQSLDQLRALTPLTEAQPPLSTPVFIPGCSQAGPAMDCPLERFRRVVKDATRDE
ncbi:histidine-type phosphatase [Nitrospirillum viridazoti]|uniref:4-phytase/acid phosphatase n=1 Tax=Nitrospirillum amazonense TaxID=28077 RepID=A0A560HWS9_9PROT|nr:histidine-type phosphatase [Nitrospirillum amazonense]TWB49989.1 4-phytase/acid phosphatase [Nitrospirillum amazonense]